MIFFLEPDGTRGVPLPTIAPENYVRPRGLIVMGGPPITGRVPENLLFTVEDGAPHATGLTDFMRGVGWMLVSEKLKGVLDQQGAEVEYVPVGVRYQGEVHSGYFIANPLRRIHGVDEVASSIELDEAGIALGVEKLVLDEAKFNGVPMSVVHEVVRLAVHSFVADAVRKAGCTGCSFVEPGSVSF